MRFSSLPRVKICCISSPEEAELAIAAGAAALGLVSAMPSGPGVIEEAQIARIARGVPPPVATFLLTAHQRADEVLCQHQFCQTSTIQLVDHVPIPELQKMRMLLPGIRLVQVIHVQGEESLREAVEVAAYVDALLLDSGNPGLAVKALGGTGRVHDWHLSRRIREAAQRLGKPVFLAGGIGAHNVVEAVRQVQPFGLDLCSSVRVEGCLDAGRLRTFFEALEGARGVREE